MSEKRYGTKSEKQKAYRERKKNLSCGVESRHAEAGRDYPDVIRGGALSQPARGGLSDDLASGSSAPPAQNYLPNPAYETASHEFQVYDARIVTYDKKKYPNRQAWEIAVQRVERAIRWAKKFPNHIYVGDLKFQTLDWQYHNEGVKAPTS